ncbi:MAG: hypothetical protein RIS69_1523 [Actinomycetota bacterium]
MKPSPQLPTITRSALHKLLPVVSFGAGAAYPEDVRFEQDWETATAVATDKLNAQQAFITGRIRLYGNQEKLVASTPVFAALDGVFSTVRTFTEYR